MAWATSHEGRDGAAYWYLHCRTCKPSCQALGAFFVHMAARPLREWRRSDVEAWLASHKEWSPRTRQKFLVTLRTFRSWAVDDMGYSVPDFLGNLRARTPPRRAVEPLSAAQVAALLRE